MQAGTIGYLLDEQARALDGMEKIKTPTLIILGEKDTLVSVEAVKQAYSKIKSESKEIIVFPEMNHFSLCFDGDY